MTDNKRYLELLYVQNGHHISKHLSVYHSSSSHQLKVIHVCQATNHRVWVFLYPSGGIKINCDALVSNENRRQINEILNNNAFIIIRKKKFFIIDSEGVKLELKPESGFIVIENGKARRTGHSNGYW